MSAAWVYPRIRVDGEQDLGPSHSLNSIYRDSKPLKSLQVWDWFASIYPGGRSHIFVEEVFSTITSSVFSELVVIFMGNAAAYLPQEVALFNALRRMHKVRPFKLMFLFEGPYPALGEARCVMARGLEYVTAKGHLDFLDSSPTIHIAQSHYFGWDN